MKLRIVTPLSVAVAEEGVRAVLAEDGSGSFGILPGHADFLTRLALSVIGWSGSDGVRRYCAVRRGVLTVTGGQEVTVATREAITGTDLATLQQTVLERFRDEQEAERVEHVESTRLQMRAIRQIMRHLLAGRHLGGGEFS